MCNIRECERKQLQLTRCNIVVSLEKSARGGFYKNGLSRAIFHFRACENFGLSGSLTNEVTDPIPIIMSESFL